MSDISAEKIVLVLRSELPAASLVNIAACLTAGITARHPWLAGQPLQDAAGLCTVASSHLPIVALKADDAVFNRILQQLQQQDAGADNCVCLFPAYAKSMHSAPEYWQQHQQTAHDGSQLSGLALLGPKKWLNKLSGNLPLLR